MSRKFIYFFFKITLCITLLGISSCWRRESVDELLIKDTVKIYLRALIEAYGKLDTSELKKIATRKEWWKVEALVGILGMKHQLLDSTLLSLQFKKINIKSNTAVAETTERWRIRYLDMKTLKEIKEPKEEVYRIRYYLVKEGIDWKVDKTEFIKE